MKLTYRLQGFADDIDWNCSSSNSDVEFLWKEPHSKLLFVKEKVPSCHVYSKKNIKCLWDM